MNQWNIPKNLEILVRERDQKCVYCGVEFTDKKINKKIVLLGSILLMMQK